MKIPSWMIERKAAQLFKEVLNLDTVCPTPTSQAKIPF
jgi:hypothetical protein